jgi:hypothetical protein
MWSLSLPRNENSREIIATALTYVNGTAKYELSEREYEIIVSIYQRYEELCGKVHEDLLANNLSNESKNAIYNGYGEVQENNRLKNYRSSLLLSAERCPCCSIGVADELDHHLPRSIYKVLALYSSNLVPMCHKCNNKKRTAAGTEPSNSFIHIYYDQVPVNERFLFAIVEISDNKMKIRFELENIASLDDDLYEMIVFQTKRVNLNNRLIKEINLFLTPYCDHMEDVYESDSDPEKVKALLLRAENRFNRKMGVNDWRSSLLNSLANNHEFCDGGFRSVLRSEKNS